MSLEANKILLTTSTNYQSLKILTESNCVIKSHCMIGCSIYFYLSKLHPKTISCQGDWTIQIIIKTSAPRGPLLMWKSSLLMGREHLPSLRLADLENPKKIPLLYTNGGKRNSFSISEWKQMLRNVGNFSPSTTT